MASQELPEPIEEKKESHEAINLEAIHKPITTEHKKYQMEIKSDVLDGNIVNKDGDLIKEETEVPSKLGISVEPNQIIAEKPENSEKCTVNMEGDSKEKEVPNHEEASTPLEEPTTQKQEKANREAEIESHSIQFTQELSQIALKGDEISATATPLLLEEVQEEREIEEVTREDANQNQISKNDESEKDASQSNLVATLSEKDYQKEVELPEGNASQNPEEDAMKEVEILSNITTRVAEEVLEEPKKKSNVEELEEEQTHQIETAKENLTEEKECPEETEDKSRDISEVVMSEEIIPEEAIQENKTTEMISEEIKQTENTTATAKMDETSQIDNHENIPSKDSTSYDQSITNEETGESNERSEHMPEEVKGNGVPASVTPFISQETMENIDIKNNTSEGVHQNQISKEDEAEKDATQGISVVDLSERDYQNETEKAIENASGIPEEDAIKEVGLKEVECPSRATPPVSEGVSEEAKKKIDVIEEMHKEQIHQNEAAEIECPADVEAAVQNRDVLEVISEDAMPEEASPEEETPQMISGEVKLTEGAIDMNENDQTSQNENGEDAPEKDSTSSHQPLISEEIGKIDEGSEHISQEPIIGTAATRDVTPEMEIKDDKFKAPTSETDDKDTEKCEDEDEAKISEEVKPSESSDAPLKIEDETLHHDFEEEKTEEDDKLKKNETEDKQQVKSCFETEEQLDKSKASPSEEEASAERDAVKTEAIKETVEDEKNVAENEIAFDSKETHNNVVVHCDKKIEETREIQKAGEDAKDGSNGDELREGNGGKDEVDKGNIEEISEEVKLTEGAIDMDEKDPTSQNENGEDAPEKDSTSSHQPLTSEEIGKLDEGSEQQEPIIRTAATRDVTPEMEIKDDKIKAPTSETDDKDTEKCEDEDETKSSEEVKPSESSDAPLKIEDETPNDFEEEKTEEDDKLKQKKTEDKQQVQSCFETEEQPDKSKASPSEEEASAEKDTVNTEPIKETEDEKNVAENKIAFDSKETHNNVVVHCDEVIEETREIQKAGEDARDGSNGDELREGNGGNDEVDKGNMEERSELTEPSNNTQASVDAEIPREETELQTDDIVPTQMTKSEVLQGAPSEGTTLSQMKVEISHEDITNGLADKADKDANEPKFASEDQIEEDAKLNTNEDEEVTQKFEVEEKTEENMFDNTEQETARSIQNEGNPSEKDDKIKNEIIEESSEVDGSIKVTEAPKKDVQNRTSDSSSEQDQMVMEKATEQDGLKIASYDNETETEKLEVGKASSHGEEKASVIFQNDDQLDLKVKADETTEARTVTIDKIDEPCITHIKEELSEAESRIEQAGISTVQIDQQSQESGAKSTEANQGNQLCEGAIDEEQHDAKSKAIDEEATTHESEEAVELKETTEKQEEEIPQINNPSEVTKVELGQSETVGPEAEHFEIVSNEKLGEEKEFTDTDAKSAEMEITKDEEGKIDQIETITKQDQPSQKSDVKPIGLDQGSVDVSTEENSDANATSSSSVKETGERSTGKEECVILQEENLVLETPKEEVEEREEMEETNEKHMEKEIPQIVHPSEISKEQLVESETVVPEAEHLENVSNEKLEDESKLAESDTKSAQVEINSDELEKEGSDADLSSSVKQISERSEESEISLQRTDERVQGDKIEAEMPKEEISRGIELAEEPCDKWSEGEICRTVDPEIFGAEEESKAMLNEEALDPQKFGTEMESSEREKVTEELTSVEEKSDVTATFVPGERQIVGTTNKESSVVPQSTTESVIASEQKVSREVETNEEPSDKQIVGELSEAESTIKQASINTVQIDQQSQESGAKSTEANQGNQLCEGAIDEEQHDAKSIAIDEEATTHEAEGAVELKETTEKQEEEIPQINNPSEVTKVELGQSETVGPEAEHFEIVSNEKLGEEKEFTDTDAKSAEMEITKDEEGKIDQTDTMIKQDQPSQKSDVKPTGLDQGSVDVSTEENSDANATLSSSVKQTCERSTGKEECVILQEVEEREEMEETNEKHMEKEIPQIVHPSEISEEQLVESETVVPEAEHLENVSNEKLEDESKLAESDAKSAQVEIKSDDLVEEGSDADLSSSVKQISERSEKSEILLQSTDERVQGEKIEAEMPKEEISRGIEVAEEPCDKWSEGEICRTVDPEIFDAEEASKAMLNEEALDPQTVGTEMESSEREKVTEELTSVEEKSDVTATYVPGIVGTTNKESSVVPQSTTESVIAPEQKVSRVVETNEEPSDKHIVGEISKIAGPEIHDVAALSKEEEVDPGKLEIESTELGKATEESTMEVEKSDVTANLVPDHLAEGQIKELEITSKEDSVASQSTIESAKIPEDRISQIETNEEPSDKHIVGELLEKDVPIDNLDAPEEIDHVQQNKVDQGQITASPAEPDSKNVGVEMESPFLEKANHEIDVKANPEETNVTPVVEEEGVVISQSADVSETLPMVEQTHAEKSELIDEKIPSDVTTETAQPASTETEKLQVKKEALDQTIKENKEINVEMEANEEKKIGIPSCVTIVTELENQTKEEEQAKTKTQEEISEVEKISGEKEIPNVAFEESVSGEINRNTDKKSVEENREYAADQEAEVRPEIKESEGPEHKDFASIVSSFLINKVLSEENQKTDDDTKQDDDGVFIPKAIDGETIQQQTTTNEKEEIEASHEEIPDVNSSRVEENLEMQEQDREQTEEEKGKEKEEGVEQDYLPVSRFLMDKILRKEESKNLEEKVLEETHIPLVGDGDGIQEKGKIEVENSIVDVTPEPKGETTSSLTEMARDFEKGENLTENADTTLVGNDGTSTEEKIEENRSVSTAPKQEIEISLSPTEVARNFEEEENPTVEQKPIEEKNQNLVSDVGISTVEKIQEHSSFVVVPEQDSGETDSPIESVRDFKKGDKNVEENNETVFSNEGISTVENFEEKNASAVSTPKQGGDTVRDFEKEEKASKEKDRALDLSDVRVSTIENTEDDSKVVVHEQKDETTPSILEKVKDLANREQSKDLACVPGISNTEKLMEERGDVVIPKEEERKNDVIVGEIPPKNLASVPEISNTEKLIKERGDMVIVKEEERKNDVLVGETTQKNLASVPEISNTEKLIEERGDVVIPKEEECKDGVIVAETTPNYVKNLEENYVLVEYEIDQFEKEPKEILEKEKIAKETGVTAMSNLEEKQSILSAVIQDDRRNLIGEVEATDRGIKEPSVSCNEIEQRNLPDTVEVPMAKVAMKDKTLHEPLEKQGDLGDNKILKEVVGKETSLIDYEEEVKEVTDTTAERNESKNQGLTEKGATKVEKKSEEVKEEEQKEEEQEEERHERETEIVGSDVPSKDAVRETETKPVQKKPHNILSGVGSKVKHSFSKVKKAITGKSKNISPSAK